MRMESEKGPEIKLNGAGNVQEVCRTGGVVKSLGIQRCNSDGILLEAGLNTSSELLTGRSSSESSITDSSPELSPEPGCNILSETACQTYNGTKVPDDLELSCNGVASALASAREDVSSQRLEHFDVVRPKTWSQRAVEKKKNHKNHRKRGKGASVKSSRDREGCAGLCSAVSDYTRNVCDVYRQENDLILGRTRGGTLTSNNKPVVLICPMSKFINGGSEFHDSAENPACSVSANNGEPATDCRSTDTVDNFPPVVAPLAVAENLSDEELLSDFDPESTTLPITEVKSIDQPETAQMSPRYTNSSQIGNLNGEVTADVDTPDVMASEIRAEINLVNEGNNPRRQSHSSSLESIDDIGDFIEADLPPNINRFAFYARGSSTEEDEGCCDEMPANTNNDEESENETIDPLSSDSHRNGRLLIGSSINKLINTNGASNALSSFDFLQRDEKKRIVSNNIVCVESMDDDNNMDLESIDFVQDDIDDDNDDEESECLSCNFKSSGTDCHNNLPHRAASPGQACSQGSQVQDVCVSCDKPVDAGGQRLAEFGVLVCDRCYNEHNSVANFGWHQKDEFGARRKSRNASGAFGTGNRVLQRNGGFNVINMKSLSHEKMNNNHLGGAMRLSSSDSDAFDRLYLTDSSEMVSPDGDQVTDSSVFQQYSDVDRSSVQFSHTQSGEKQDKESRPIRSGPRHSASLEYNTVDWVPRHSASLEYNTAEDVLYCPFYTRRSRSLDQEITVDTTTDRSEIDTPNIAVASSNFQEDEINNQEKVFEKDAYRVPDTCCSSDEDENTRVPQDEPEACMVKHQATGGVLPESESMEMLFVKATQGPRPRPDEEPIYEDIEGLERLMGTALSDSENEGRPTTTQPLCNAISKLRRKKHYRSSPVSDVEKVMIWNEYEAYVVQVKQIGTSACGPTAVLNVLKAFDFQVDKDEVSRTIQANLRMEAAPIPYYLFSRYSAGTTAQALVDGVATVTRGTIKGRFFHFYPQRDVELLKWLGHWMKKGAVPVATLNLQRGVKPGWTIPDAWHHQMVYGVSSKGVHLTNPLEIVQENVILDQLTSDSVLLVRRHDVVSRFKEWCPLNELLKQPDPRWRNMNVLGQIVHMLREQCMPADQLTAMRSQLTSHVCIPAVYKAGIILFVRANSDVYQELLQAPELPLKVLPTSTT